MGLSGGLDSAVVAALCQRVFPNDNIGVIMPCDSDPTDVRYARLLAERIGMRTITVDLTETWEMLCTTVEGSLPDAPDETSIVGPGQRETAPADDRFVQCGRTL